MRRLAIKLERDDAMTVTRVAVGADRLVYVLVADKRVQYDGAKSRVVYIGTTRKGARRLASSAAERADDILSQHGIRSFRVRVLVCRSRQRVRTWHKLERALLLVFKEMYGTVPLCNSHGVNMDETDEFYYFARPRPEALRGRLLELLASSKGRSKLRSSLAHFRDLDIRFARLLEPSKRHARDIELMLRAKGAPDTCHVLSEASELDGREMPLESALRAIVGRGMGAFVSCIPGRLGYFESEELGERYILERAV